MSESINLMDELMDGRKENIYSAFRCQLKRHLLCEDLTGPILTAEKT